MAPAIRATADSGSNHCHRWRFSGPPTLPKVAGNRAKFPAVILGCILGLSPFLRTAVEGRPLGCYSLILQAPTSSSRSVDCGSEKLGAENPNQRPSQPAWAEFLLTCK